MTKINVQYYEEITREEFIITDDGKAALARDMHPMENVPLGMTPPIVWGGEAATIVNDGGKLYLVTTL